MHTTTAPLLDAVRKEKRILEEAVRDLVATFEQRTGVQVINVDVTRLDVGCHRSLLTDVYVETRL